MIEDSIMNNENMLLIGGREQTQKKALEVIMEKINEEGNLIITDTASRYLYDNTVEIAKKRKYKIVRLDPYARHHQSIDIMQSKDDDDKEVICSSLPEYLLGEMFIGEPEEYISPSKYTWSSELISYMLANQQVLKQLKKFLRASSVKKVADQLYHQEPQLVAMLGGEPPWRIADDLTDIRNTLFRRLSAKKEVEMLSHKEYDLTNFGKEKTIIYIAPIPESRLEPFIIERILELNSTSMIPCTVIMDEGSCIREPYQYEWNINTNYLLMLHTDTVPSCEYIKSSCRQTYYCA